MKESTEGALKVYDGIGTYDSSGTVTYLVSLPASEKNNIRPVPVSCINLGSSVFIQMTVPGRALENPANELISWSFDIPNFVLGSAQSISVFLWHNDVAVTNAADAAKVMASPSSQGGNPKKCGTGILTFDQ